MLLLGAPETLHIASTSEDEQKVKQCFFANRKLAQALFLSDRHSGSEARYKRVIKQHSVGSLDTFCKESQLVCSFLMFLT